MKILVMDDEEFIREFMMEALDLFGHQAVAAENGESAIEEYKQAHAEGNPFDLILLDLTVCEGMGGEETLKAIQSIDPEVKAVALSGHKTGDVYHNFKDYGFLAYLLKPVELDEMEKTLISLGSNQ